MAVAGKDVRRRRQIHRLYQRVQYVINLPEQPKVLNPPNEGIPNPWSPLPALPEPLNVLQPLLEPDFYPGVRNCIEQPIWNNNTCHLIIEE